MGRAQRLGKNSLHRARGASWRRRTWVLEIAEPAPPVQAANAMSGAASLGREHRSIMREHVSDMKNPRRMAGAVEVLPSLEALPIAS